MLRPERMADEPTIEDLGGKKRHAEAGRVLLDYCGDVRGAVGALVEGNEFAEARRVVSVPFLHVPWELF